MGKFSKSSEKHFFGPFLDSFSPFLKKYEFSRKVRPKFTVPYSKTGLQDSRQTSLLTSIELLINLWLFMISGGIEDRSHSLTKFA